MRAQKKKRVTAQPKPSSDDIGTYEPTEEGLSIDPEEMGQSFIRYATEQGNDEALAPEAEPGTDETLDTPYELEAQPARGVAEIDLTQSVIEEASLLDEESEELGEVIPKQPRTDDNRHHKSRG